MRSVDLSASTDRVTSGISRISLLGQHFNNSAGELKHYLSEFYKSAPPELTQIVGKKSDLYALAQLISDLLKGKNRLPLTRDAAILAELAVRHLVQGITQKANNLFIRQNSCSSFETLDNNISLNNNGAPSFDLSASLPLFKFNNDILSEGDSAANFINPAGIYEEVKSMEDEIDQLFTQKNELSLRVAAVQNDKNILAQNETMKYQLLEEKLKNTKESLKAAEELQRQTDRQNRQVHEEVTLLINKLSKKKEKLYQKNDKIRNLENDLISIRNELDSLKANHIVYNHSSISHLSTPNKKSPFTSEDKANYEKEVKVERSPFHQNQSYVSDFEVDSFKAEILNLKKENFNLQSKYDQLKIEKEKQENEFSIQIEQIENERTKVEEEMGSKIKEIKEKSKESYSIIQQKLFNTENLLNIEKNKPSTRPVLVQVDNNKDVEKIATIADSLALFLFDIFSSNSNEANQFIKNKKYKEKGKNNLLIFDNTKSRFSKILPQVLQEINDIRKYLLAFSPKTIPIFDSVFDLINKGNNENEEDPKSVNETDKKSNILKKKKIDFSGACNDPFFIAIISVINVFREQNEEMYKLFEVLNEDKNRFDTSNSKTSDNSSISSNSSNTFVSVNKDELPKAIVRFHHQVYSELSEIKELLEKIPHFSIVFKKFTKKKGIKKIKRLENIDFGLLSNLIKLYIQESTEVFNKIGDSIRKVSETKNFNGYYFDLPHILEDVIIQKMQELESISKNDTDTMNSQSPQTSQQKEKNAQKDEKAIDELTEKLREMSDQKNELEKMFKDFHMSKEELEEKNKSLLNEIERLNTLIKEKSKLYENRLKSVANEQQLRSRKEIERAEKSASLQIQLISRKMESKELKIADLKKKVKQLEKNKESLTELKGVSSAGSELSEKSGGFVNLELDKEFIDEVGKKLNKCFKKEGEWTQKLVVKAVTSLVDRVIVLEKKSLSASTKSNAF